MALFVLIGLLTAVEAFVAPQARTSTPWTVSAPVSPTARPMLDPFTVMDAASSFADGSAASIVNGLSSNLLAFSDQGQNLAGIFFQASLLPYLLFLYFLQFRANRLSAVGNFGFQFVLMFVLSTIPSGIVSKSVYGTSLANVDWLHGGAEALLTLANVFIVLGLKDAMTKPEPSVDIGKGRLAALGAAGLFFAALAVGPALGVEAHSPFLLGLGDLPSDWTLQLPWISHNEPENALSIPTWAIHFSSVIEYLFAMNLVWNFSKTSGKKSWKGLTWGMLPLHASGICACTYHFFYNPSSFQFLVTLQAGLTLLGNLTCAIAAYRIARSNGWTLDEVNPFPKSATNPTGLVADGIAALPLEIDESQDEPKQILAAKLIVLTLLASYAVKYGELGLDLPFTPNAPVALAMVIGIPAITALQYYNLSEGGFQLPSFGGDGDNKPSLSMADVKKYGVAGTVAYVLTELAFWVVAFPAAATALYRSTGHWPDVINDNNDRAAVLAAIFAGANIARLFVPLRLGAALALAPWVDENLLGGSKTEETIDVEKVEL